jgi:hypothetical protein
MNFASELFLSALAMMVSIVVVGYVVSMILTSLRGEK